MRSDEKTGYYVTDKQGDFETVQRQRGHRRREKDPG